MKTKQELIADGWEIERKRAAGYISEHQADEEAQKLHRLWERLGKDIEEEEARTS